MAWPKGKPRKGYVPMKDRKVDAKPKKRRVAKKQAKKSLAEKLGEEQIRAQRATAAMHSIILCTASQLDALAVFFEGFDRNAVEYVAGKLRERVGR